MGTVVALAFIGTSIALIATAIWKLLRDRILTHRGILAEGRIVAIKEGHDADWPVIAFADKRGGTHQFRSDLSQSSGTIRIGATVPVRYDPLDPHRAHQVGKPGRRAFLYVLLVVGGLVGGYGGLMMLCDGVGLLCGLPH